MSKIQMILTLLTAGAVLGGCSASEPAAPPPDALLLTLSDGTLRSIPFSGEVILTPGAGNTLLINAGSQEVSLPLEDIRDLSVEHNANR